MATEVPSVARELEMVLIDRQRPIPALQPGTSVSSTVVALVLLMLFLLLRMICRKTPIAVVVFCLLGAVFGALYHDTRG